MRPKSRNIALQDVTNCPNNASISPPSIAYPPKTNLKYALSQLETSSKSQRNRRPTPRDQTAPKKMSISLSLLSPGCHRSKATSCASPTAGDTSVVAPLASSSTSTIPISQQSSTEFAAKNRSMRRCYLPRSSIGKCWCWTWTRP